MENIPTHSNHKKVSMKHCETCQCINDEYLILKWQPLMDKVELPDDKEVRVKTAIALEKVSDLLKRQIKILDINDNL